MNDLVGLLRWHRVSSDAQSTDAWTAYVAWCASRQIYVGGTAAAAVLYAPEHGQIIFMWKTIQRKAHRMLSPNEVELSVAPLRALPSVRMRQSALEAIVVAQDALSDDVAATVSSLAALAAGSAVDFDVTVAAGGQWLTARWIQRDIDFTVTRLDGRPDAALLKWREAPFQLEDLASFCTDWEGLSWRRVRPLSDLVSGGWDAESGQWRLSFTTNPRSSLSEVEIRSGIRELLMYEVPQTNEK